MDYISMPAQAQEIHYKFRTRIVELNLKTCGVIFCVKGWIIEMNVLLCPLEVSLVGYEVSPISS
jgi:hypothetical protein